MTLCVALLFDGGASVATASDRMITSGDVKFEPLEGKVWQITSAIGVMIAGHAALHRQTY